MKNKLNKDVNLKQLLESRPGIDPKAVESVQAFWSSFGFRAVATVNTPLSPNVRIWRIVDGTQIIFDENAVDAIFSPDGLSVATLNTAESPNVRIWGISDGQEIIFDDSAVRVVFNNRPPSFEFPHQIAFSDDQVAKKP